MRNVAFMAFSLVIVLITGCFHDDNDSSYYIAVKQPAAGVYLSVNSAFFSEATGHPIQIPVDVIISRTGEARFLFFSSSSIPMLYPQLAGNVDVVVDKFTASLKTYSDGNAQTSSAALDGTVVIKDNITGDYTWGQDFGRFVLNYSPLYEDPSALSKLEGIWSFSQASSGGGIFTFTLTIDSDGTVFGSNTAGCVYNGTFNIVDARYNVYSLSLEASLCGDLDGVYDGLASLFETGFDRSLMFGTSNQEHSLSGILKAPLQP